MSVGDGAPQHLAELLELALVPAKGQAARAWPASPPRSRPAPRRGRCIVHQRQRIPNSLGRADNGVGMNRTLLTLAVAATAGAAAAQVPAGPQFRVNTYTTSFQYAPRIGLERDGDFVVTWRSFLQDGSATGVFSQRFALDASPRGIEFRVNVYTTGNQTTPSSPPAGATTPSSCGPTTPGAGSRHGGTTPPAPLEANSGSTPLTSSYRREPSIAAARVGAFSSVTWGGNDDGSGSSISARLFDAEGSPTAPEFRGEFLHHGDPVLPGGGRGSRRGLCGGLGGHSNFLPSPQWSGRRPAARRRRRPRGRGVPGQHRFRLLRPSTGDQRLVIRRLRRRLVAFSQVSGRRYDAEGTRSARIRGQPVQRRPVPGLAAGRRPR